MMLLQQNVSFQFPQKYHKTPKSKSPKSTFLNLNSPIPETLIEISTNKVLIASTFSAIIGQLLKPFTNSILFNNKNPKFVDLKTIVQPGGFPSTHSSSVVAAATLLGLERGFGDTVFGMSVIFAAIVMYDSQGVRREAGSHAKLLNKIVKESDSELLKEVLGHTEIEVFAGAVLGFVVSLAVYNFM